MKNLRWTLGLSIFLFTAISLFIGLALTKITSQAQEKSKVEENKVKSQIKINWEPTYYPLSRKNSEFALTLPETVADANLVVGIEQVKKDEPEGIAVAVVEWRELENFSQGFDFKPKVISNITSYSPDSITSLVGQVELTKAIEDDKSLLVHLKIKPQTDVKLRKGNTEFVRKIEGKDGIFYRSEITEAESSKIPFLLNRLSMSRFVQNQENNLRRNNDNEN